jgi:hypothetical protein
LAIRFGVARQVNVYLAIAAQDGLATILVRRRHSSVAVVLDVLAAVTKLFEVRITDGGAIGVFAVLVLLANLITLASRVSEQ